MSNSEEGTGRRDKRYFKFRSEWGDTHHASVVYDFERKVYVATVDGGNNIPMSLGISHLNPHHAAHEAIDDFHAREQTAP